MDDAGGRFNDGLDIEAALSLETIEQQIAQLWHPDTERDDPIGSLATRSAVLNLVIYASDAEAGRRAQDVSRRLSQIHPCRVILFNHAPELSRTRFAPDIYSTCEADGSNSQAPCIERIQIPISDELYKQMTSLTQPLIIPELPAFLWWPDPPSPFDQTFIAMARASNMTIIDSLRFESSDDLIHFAELGLSLSSGAAMTDLNWQRLQPWRELTAQFFDIRTANWALNHIREIEIDAGHANGNILPTQALMLTSWLAHCLHWKPSEVRRTRNDRWYIGMRDQNGEHVKVIIRTRPITQDWSGHLLSMSMSARDREQHSSTLSLSRSRGSSLIRMSAQGDQQNVLHHAVYHPLLPDEALLIPILESTVRDHVFEASLEMGIAMLELLNNREVK